MNSKIIKQGLDQIASIDADVKKGLDLVGYPEPRIRPEGFESLLAIILGQQPPGPFFDSQKKLCGVLDFLEEKSSMPKALP